MAAVRVRGGLEEEIHVQLDEEKLRQTGISPSQVIDRLRQENVNVAGGTIEEGRTEYMVRTLNEYQDLDQIADTIVARVEPAAGTSRASAAGSSGMGPGGSDASGGGGAGSGARDIRVRDLGRVVRSQKDRQIITETDGAESVQLDVYKEADANIVALAQRVKTAIGEIETPEERAQKRQAEEKARSRHGKPGGPGGAVGEKAGLAQRLFDEESVKLDVVADRSTFIEGSIKDVKDAAIYGGLLAVLVLFLFLANVRTTAIIAVAIPISLAVTFAPLNLFGVSLNIMSLGGLALGVGMLVDSSIVVLESIFRCHEEGDDVETAAVRGTAEVRGAVTASTLTTIAVFFPMVFVEGIAGQAFGDLGLAVVISLLASLAVAVFLIPMLASRKGVDLDALASGKQRVRLSRFGSWGAFIADLRRLPLWAKITLLAPVYLVLRLVLGLLLELLGKIVLAVVMLLTLVWTRLVLPVGRGLLLVSTPMLRRTVGGVDRLQNAYPRFARAALAHSGLVVVATAAILAATV